MGFHRNSTGEINMFNGLGMGQTWDFTFLGLLYCEYSKRKWPFW
jgi:hypothetical protein